MARESTIREMRIWDFIGIVLVSGDNALGKSLANSGSREAKIARPSAPISAGKCLASRRAGLHSAKAPSQRTGKCLQIFFKLISD